MKKGSVVGLLLSILSVSGLGALVGFGVIDVPFLNQDEPTLIIEKLIVSIDINEDDIETVNINALDKKGVEESFTFIQDGNNSQIEIFQNSLSISGMSVGNDNITVFSESGLNQSFTIQVHDRFILDDGSGLLFAFVDQFDYKWYDEGTGADKDVRFSHPIIPDEEKYENFYAVGSLARGNWAQPNNIDWGIIVKDRDNSSLLAAPVDYIRIWADGGSGGNDDGSIWSPIAPEGYVAMGLVAQAGYSKPSVDIVRCVKEELTVNGRIGPAIWNDLGSGADLDFGSWQIIEPNNIASEDGKAFLRANTFIGAGGYSSASCNLSNANCFYINLPTMEEYNSENQEPYLTDYKAYGNINPRYSKSIFVPFTFVGDNIEGHNLHWRITNSPFYYMQRVEEYSSLDYFDNRQGSNDVTKTITFTTGMSTTHTEMFSTELGIEVSVGNGVGLLGTGAEYSVKVTTTLKWETTDTSQYSESTEKSTEYTIPSGKFGELLQVTGKFLLISGNGLVVGELPMESSGLKILEYPVK